MPRNKKTVPDGYWKNKDNCIAEARKYDSFRDFRIFGSGSCLHVMYENGWIDECDWLVKDRTRERQRVAQYTLDGQLVKIWDCMDEAGKYFGVKAPCHISQCCHFKRVKAHGYRWLFERDMDRAEELFNTYKNKIIQKPGGYTEKEVREEAKKYRTLKEFSDGSYYYYRAARRMGIINDIEFPEKAHNPYADNSMRVYAYEFNETHSVYVGITDDIKRRDGEHRRISRKRTSSVNRHSKESGIAIPKPKILVSGIGPLEARAQEDIWVGKYREQGWNILNKAKTGKNSGAIGTLRKISNKEILEAASRFTYVRDFRAQYPSLYATASHRGLRDKLNLLNAKRNRAVIAFSGFRIKVFHTTKGAKKFAKEVNGWRYYYLDEIA